MSQIQVVKEASDLATVVGERIQLTRAGGNWRALCPFHSEKTPSFYVSDQLQHYKCFGCGASGDVFNFLVEFDGLTFYEALELLAQKAGIKLETTVRSQSDDERLELLRVLDLARQYYHYLLTEHKQGETARKYLKERGVTADSIKLFQLGYALPAWDGLVKYLTRKKKFAPELLVKAGLAVHGRSGLYDRFRDRVVFPLRDHRGRVVGFSGRLLDKTAKEAKYINSPETLLYHKAELLFGLSELREQIKAAGEVVVVEGEFDVISSAQAHVDHVVAIKGSAFTEGHAKRLDRLVSRVILCLDSDLAGVEATKRALQILRGSRLELRVVVLTDGKDPDDLARRDPKLWRETVKRHQPAVSFLIQTALRQHDKASGRGRRQILEELSPVFGSIESAVEYDFFLKELATGLGVDSKLVKTDLQHFGKTGRLRSSEPELKETKPTTPPAQLLREQYVAYLLLHAQDSRRAEWAAELAQLPLELPGLKALAQHLGQAEGDLKQALTSAPSDLQDLAASIFFDRLLVVDMDQLDLPSEWTKSLTELRRVTQHHQRQALTAKLKQLEAEPASEQRDQAMQRLLQQLAEFKN